MTRDEFIDTIMEQASLSKEDAQRITVAILHTLRSQLSKNEIRDVYDTLPEDIDRFWEGGWMQRVMSWLQGLRYLDREDFIEQVREAADVKTSAEAQRLADVVFSTLKRAIPSKEVEHISHDLPEDIQQLWNAA
ncbi:MAG TPA: DUF2267 domain-containing protein [Candidatus Aquicultor sp.]|jgi:uncharacterized protein (DUF2267 family)